MSNTSKATSTKTTESHLSSLQLTEQHKVQSQDPIIQRRNKLIERLEVQREMAKCLIENEVFTAYKEIIKVDEETGDTQKVRVPKQIKPWFYKHDGQYFTTIKYGAKTLELSKGLHAIAVGNKSTLTSVYDTVIACVKAGELDTQLLAIKAVGKK